MGFREDNGKRWKEFKEYINYFFDKLISYEHLKWKIDVKTILSTHFPKFLYNTKKKFCKFIYEILLLPSLKHLSKVKFNFGL